MRGEAGKPADDPRDAERSTIGEGLFGGDEQFHKAYQHWGGMPEYVMEDLQPYYVLIVNFFTPEDLEAFEKLIDQKVPRTFKRAPSIQFPKPKHATAKYMTKRYRQVEEVGS